MSQQRLAEIKLASARAQLASRYGAKDDGVTDCTGALLGAFDVAFLLARIDELEKVVADVRAIHQSVKFDLPVGEVCRGCWTDKWPCETLAALGGEE